MKRILLTAVIFFIMLSNAMSEEDLFTKLTNDTMLYFKPLSGTIASVSGEKVVMQINAKDMVRQGMRLKVLREGAPFIHPLTKELLGKVESTIGKVEVRDIQPESYAGIIVDGEAKAGDKVRISETKIKMFFCQDKNVDWFMADEYYRKLKETGRIEMIDSALETGDETKALEEAKRLGAEVVLLLAAKETDKGTLLRQQIFWVSDGSRFNETEIKVDMAVAKELKFGEELFNPRTGEAMLEYDLPFGAKLVTTGDFDGDGKQEIVLSTGTDARVYISASDLQNLWKVKGSAEDDHIWIDSVDLNKNGRDELIITSMKNGEIISCIYELAGSEFKKLWEGKYFLRRSGAGLFAQAFSSSDGFAGDIFAVTWNGEYKMGDRVKVPDGINIYDFLYIDSALSKSASVEGTAGENNIFAYDEKGFLNLYNAKGVRTWRSTSDTGGFLTSFKIKSTTAYMDSGEWSIKDRLVLRQKEVLAVERIPLVQMVKALGYKSSKIRNYWWNGFSMEEGILINDIKGSVLDYALAGDKIIVLTSPLMGMKFGNILKGENPLGTTLYIYSLKGR